MGIKTRVRLMKCYVWSGLLYGCETWTISKGMRKRLEAAEMWFYRRMMRIPWTARITNEEVLERVGVGRSLIGTIRKRQLSFLGHILRGIVWRGIVCWGWWRECGGEADPEPSLWMV